MSNEESKEERIARLIREKRTGLRLRTKGERIWFEAAAELAALVGDDAVAASHQKKIDKHLKAKAARVGKPEQKSKSKKKAAAAAVKPIPPKDFACEAHLITGVPCKGVANALVPAAATRHEGKRVATCKACKKTAVKAASSSSKGDSEKEEEA